jgi:hypothetical protein
MELPSVIISGIDPIAVIAMPLLLFEATGSPPLYFSY